MGGAAGKAAGKVYDFGQRAQEATRKLQEMNDRIGKMSGLLHMVQTEGEIRDQLRSREQGDRTSSSARALMESDQANKDNQKEQTILLARIDNYFQSLENYLSAIANWPLDKISKQLNSLLPGDDAKGGTLAEAAQKLYEQIQQEEKDAQKRMNGK
ncbi:hypothetical protein PX52LOC_04555 [Limnoglobus roseus]|uniref:Uncharacterized protein n=2 Tax=Limnoglobus roseus TaxID=2598579 RepID=A0A5C1AFH5_9BACT|nr:hypothetical protein PX52LOC_04555 [Limnoglobus roseus]